MATSVYFEVYILEIVSEVGYRFFISLSVRIIYIGVYLNTLKIILIIRNNL